MELYEKVMEVRNFVGFEEDVLIYGYASRKWKKFKISEVCIVKMT